ncbi:MAG TPA: acyltransferase [Streptosporangiaceae bacterium]|nr:acyltransferase [Streptosporangiaceae bacterium]
MPDATATSSNLPGPGSSPAPGAAKRLAWLDALRGVAALCVVFDHLGYYVLQHARHLVYQWFDPGTYGVFVFFLVSGYIVPASLERKGSVRTFWVSRVFRLYPLYLTAMGGAAVLSLAGLDSLRGAAQDPETSGLGSILMLSNVLGVPNAINVIWTLSYEMAFYLLLTALFTGGVHRRSSASALGFAVAAVALGGVLPMTALSGGFLGTRLVAQIADLLIAGGIALAVTRYRIPKLVGAGLAGGTAMVLVAVNGQYIEPWEAFTILALMFTGTVAYRAEHGDLSRPRAAALAVAVFALCIAAGLWHSHAWGISAGAEVQWERRWVSSLALAGVTFAVGMACRHKRVPSFLAWLGLISYSVYLLHPLLISLYYHTPGTRGPHPFPVQVLMAAAFLAAVLACSAVTHRFIEAPMQRQGRKLAACLDRWFGPERVPEPVRHAPAEATTR